MLRVIYVPRSIKPDVFDANQPTGRVLINQQGRIYFQLIMSRNKVVPLKQCSIPRLELQAAMLAAKMGSAIGRELDIEIDSSHF